MLLQDVSEPRTTAPMWSAAPPVSEAVTLEELTLLLGALKPEAVCRIGREVARALARVHADVHGVDGALTASRIVIDAAGHVSISPLLAATGGLLRVDEPRLLAPERRGTAYAAEPGDDLYALGVLTAEAALGHPLDAPNGYLDMRVLDGAMPERLLDAIAALVAPPDRRLTNAAAAMRVFADLESRFGDGARALGAAAEHARLGAAFGGLGASLEGGEDAEGPITIPDPTPLPDDFAHDPAAIGPFRKHEIAFFARGIVIAPPPVARPQPRRRSLGTTLLGALVGLAVGALVLAVALPALQTEAHDALDADAPIVVVAAASSPAPAVAEPLVAAPIVAEAVATEPVAAKPVVAEPAAKPVVAEPVVAEPAAKPVVAEPVVAEPAAKPVVAKAVAAKTVVAKPAAAKPAVAKPAAKPVAAKPAAAPVVVDAAEPAADGPAVRLIVDGNAAARARAEAALRSCAIDGPILGALEVKNRKIVRVTSDPKNGCVERVLKRTLGGYREDQPFEIELR